MGDGGIKVDTYQPAGGPRFHRPYRGGYNPFHHRGGGRGYHHHYHQQQRSQGPHNPYHQPYHTFTEQSQGGDNSFDGKRMLRKNQSRKTVDFNSSVINHLENRIWQRDYRDLRAIQPDSSYTTRLVPPVDLLAKPTNCVTTKFVRTSTNKIRCPIFCLAWTPEGRRLVTGASSGEFTLWNGLTFNFETILQAHDVAVRAMQWDHGDQWMITGDHGGYIKYWQSNMNNVKMFQAHKDQAVRGISFSPSDNKFATCSDDGTVRIWDFLRCEEENIMRGHGSDVKCVDWHPHKSLVVSGSKDSQQPIILWDARTAARLSTFYFHKNTTMDVKWNKNGNWLATASRDHLVKIFDIRTMKEMQTFRGHKKEATALSWHPIHERLMCSGGYDGSILFWIVGCDKEVGSIDTAHDSLVWSMAWHPMGHILATGSNDHTTKFWTRNRPGDKMRDRYNLNTLPMGMSDDMFEIAESGEYVSGASSREIPGMGLADESRAAATAAGRTGDGAVVNGECLGGKADIPGLAAAESSASVLPQMATLSGVASLADKAAAGPSQPPSTPLQPLSMLSIVKKGGGSGGGAPGSAPTRPINRLFEAQWTSINKGMSMSAVQLPGFGGDDAPALLNAGADDTEGAGGNEPALPAVEAHVPGFPGVKKGDGLLGAAPLSESRSGPGVGAGGAGAGPPSLLDLTIAPPSGGLRRGGGEGESMDTQQSPH